MENSTNNFKILAKREKIISKIKILINSYKERRKEFTKELKEAWKDLKSLKTAGKQMPNIISCLRIILISIIDIFIFFGSLTTAGILIGIAGLTDKLDGTIARKCNLTSELGRKLDALNDKLFMFAVGIPLSIINPYLIIPIILDVGVISIINSYAHINGYKVETSKAGKAKTALLFTFFLLSCFNTYPNFQTINYTLLIGTIGFEFKAIHGYYQSLKIQKKEKNINEKINKKKEELQEIIDIMKSFNVNYVELTEKKINNYQKEIDILEKEKEYLKNENENEKNIANPTLTKKN